MSIPWSSVLCRGLAAALCFLATCGWCAEPREAQRSHEPTRWQAGFVRYADAWRSPAEVARLARADGRLVEYARLRDGASTSAVDQAAIARWCSRSRLPDEARVHWLAVLAAQPNDPEAIAALGLRPFNGQWLTAEQIATVRTRIKQVEKATAAWQPLVARWRRAAERVDGTMPADIAERIAGIETEAELQAVWSELARQAGGNARRRVRAILSRHLVAALDSNPRPLASAALVDLAVHGEPEDVRTAAIAALPRRPLDHSVPLLLAGLRMPLEPTAATAPGALGFPIVRFGLAQEGMLGDEAVSLLVSPEVANPLVSPDDAAGSVAAEDLTAFELSRSASWGQAARDAAAFHASVARANAAIAERNRRIYCALTAASGRELPATPTAWWTWWWQDYTEMISFSDPALAGANPSAKPVQTWELVAPYVVMDPYSSDMWTNEYAKEIDRATTRPDLGSRFYTSCFARGTPVWTLTGLVPIEAVKRGDRVLAQDPVSGELAYKPVLATTTRPPGPRVQVGLAAESIMATPSHPFWVHGSGWVMAKHLRIGDRLHAHGGGVTIDALTVVPTPEEHYEQAFNLIVADFPTYFVGRRGLLVHDHTPSVPTSNPVPGLVRR